ncbi:hypothetical protein ACEPAI_4476 [Sanghuangporus weigelae]
MSTLQGSNSIAVVPVKEPDVIHVKGIEVKFRNLRGRKYAISVHLAIGDNNLYDSETLQKQKKTITAWDVDLKIPSTSTFTIVIQEHHTLRRKSVFNASIIADRMIAKPLVPILDERNEAVIVNIRCEAIGPLVELICELVEESQNRLAEMKTFLEQFGAVCEGLNLIISIIDPVAETHPAVKVVVEAVKTLCEVCKKQIECHEAATGLMRDIKSFLPFTKIPLERLKGGVTKETVYTLLETFTKVSSSIIRYSSQTSLGNLLDDHTDEIDDFKAEFKRLKETFDWCVKTEIWRTVLEIENDTRSMHLDKLRPVPQSFYDTKKSCFEGTREETLQTIQRWSTSESGLFWLHGTEGSGKTAIAHTMAQVFDEQNRLAGCFFFNRDDPACRNQDNIIPTIAYQLAKLHEDYCDLVLGILRGPDERNIHTSLDQQFSLLLDRPLTMLLRTHFERLPPVHRPLVIVLDSPELCCDSDSEFEWHRLVYYLRDIGTIVPQLKICICSRKFPEIDALSGSIFQQLDISDPFTDLRLDISTFLQHRGNVKARTTSRHNDFAYKRDCLSSRIQTALRRADLWIGSHYFNTQPQKTPNEIFHVPTWKDIVAQSGDTKAFHDSVADILCSAKVLIWIDVLFFVGKLDTEKDVLSDCAEYFKEDEIINRAANELLDFIADFEPVIALGISHIYASALVWLSMDSPVRRGIRPRVPKIVFESFPKPASDAVIIDSKPDIICTTRSPSGSRIVSGSDNGRLGIWDGATGARIGKEIEGHTDDVYDVRYSPDGTRFVSGSIDGTVKIWDFTGKLVTKMQTVSGVFAVAFSTDGCRVISGHENGILRNWDAQNGNLVTKWRGHEYVVRAVAYSPDGTRIVSGSDDKSVRIWDAQSGAAVGEPLEGHEDWVYAVAYSPDGSRVVSGSLDNATVRIWDAHAGNQIGEPLKGHKYAVVDVGYSQDGSRIISASWDDKIRFWNATNGDPVGVLRRGESRWDAERQHFVSIPKWWPTLWWLKSFSIQSLVYSSNPLYVPEDGWIRTLDGGLLLWVPPQHRHCSCHAARESTVTTNDRDERLKTSVWKDIPQRTNWMKMMNVEESDWFSSAFWW